MSTFLFQDRRCGSMRDDGRLYYARESASARIISFGARAPSLTRRIFIWGDSLTDQISYHAKRGEHAERHFIPIVSVPHVKVQNRHFA